MLLTKFKTFLYLFLLWAGILANNFVWLKYDNTYFTYDSHRHFLASLRIYEILKSLNFHAIPVSINTIQLHPPFVMITTSLFYFLFGISQHISVVANSAIFLGILIFATYGIGFKIADRKTGLLAAFIVSMYPVIFNQLKIYMLDLPLTAMVALSVYFLLCSDNFKNIKYSILFSLSAGLGMLTKSSFLLYLIAPLSYIVIKNILIFRKENYSLKKYIGYFVLFGTLIVLICSLYYSTNFYKVLSKAYSGYVSTWLEVVPPSGLFLHNLRAFLWYIWGFINWQVSFFFFVVCLIGAYFFARTKVSNKRLFIFWIFIPWLLVSYLRHAIGFNMEITGIRYTLPILPAIALVSAIGIMKISIKNLRLFLICLIAIFGIAQLLFVSYPISVRGFTKRIFYSIKIPQKLNKYKLLPEEIILINFKDWSVSGRVSSSYPNNYQDYFTANQRIFSIINSSRGGKEAVAIFIIPDDARLWYLQYQAYRRGKKFQFFCDWNYLRAEMGAEGNNVFDLISSSDYVIDKDGEFLGESYMQSFVESARNNFAVLKPKFMLFWRLNWPDGSRILIYKKKNLIF
ncbi:MAG: glycosyltransferase family 39 protein [Candidatus Omnitrophota bacterium]